MRSPQLDGPRAGGATAASPSQQFPSDSRSDLAVQPTPSRVTGYQLPCIGQNWFRESDPPKLGAVKPHS